MRVSADQIARRSNQSRKKGRTTVAAGNDAPPVLMPFFGLPSVAPKVFSSFRYVDPGEDQKWLQVAGLCSTLVGEDFKVDETADVMEIVGAALSAWASALCAGIKHLDSFSIVASLNDDEFEYSRSFDEKAASSWFIALESGQTMPYFTFDDALDVLDCNHPGLARTITHLIQMASYRTFPALMPESAFDLATMLYWRGEEDDASVVQTMLAEGDLDEGDEVSDDMWLPSKFKAAFADYFFGDGFLSIEELRCLLNQENVKVVDIVSTLISMWELIDTRVCLPDFAGYEIDHLYFSCVISNNKDREDDPVVQLLDDHMEYGYSGDGFSDYYGITRVPYEEGAFQQWRANMEQAFALYATLDKLIGLLDQAQQEA